MPKGRPSAREKVVQLSQRLAEFGHLATLENALERCRDEDMRMPDVKGALADLAKTITDPWPIDQIKRALDNTNDEGRWQLANASLNAIKLYVTR